MTVHVTHFNLTDSERVRTRLQESLRTRGGSPSGVFELLSHVLEVKLWLELPRGRDGESFETFLQFVETPEPYGLGLHQGDLKALMKVKAAEERGGESDVSRRFDEMRRQVQGLIVDDKGHQGQRLNLLYNVKEVERPGGHSETYARRRLRRNRPDLYEQVESGHLSAHAAMLEAGFLHKTVSIRVDDPESAARTLRKHFDGDALAVLVTQLTGGP